MTVRDPSIAAAAASLRMTEGIAVAARIPHLVVHFDRS